MNKDISIDLYLHGDLKLHRGHISFLEYYFVNDQHLLPAKHKFVTDLVKTGHIFEDQITDKGNALIRELLAWDGVYTPKEKVKKKVVEYSPEFIEFWEAYPASDNFEYAGVEFNGTRSLRVEKGECHTKYQNILNENKYTHRELMEALEWEKVARMDQSVIRNKNEFSYFPGTGVYLNQRKFETYIPLAKKGPYKPKSIVEKKELIETEKLF